ncbi:MAG: GNAT family N-acetyltransferase [Devosia sp.]
MSAVLIASITELCIADHQRDPERLSRWLANKTPEAVAAWFDAETITLFVAEHDGKIAAAGGINRDGSEIVLNYVAPRYRFLGVSRALLGAMEQVLGPGEASLTSTHTAHRFYLSAGWTDAGAIDRYAGMTAFPMRKML